jgi:hypothetical protein
MNLLFFAKKLEEASRGSADANLLVSASEAIRATEYRLNAIEIALGTLCRKAGVTIDDLELPDLPVGAHGGHITPEISHRRHMTWQFALGIFASAPGGV